MPDVNIFCKTEPTQEQMNKSTCKKLVGSFLQVHL